MLVINLKKEEMNKFCKRQRQTCMVSTALYKYNLRIIKIFRQVNLNDPKPWVSHLKSEVKVFKVN